MKTHSLITNNGRTNNDKSLDTEERNQQASATRALRTDPVYDNYDKLTPVDVYSRSSAYDDGWDLAKRSNDFRPNPETEDQLRAKWQKIARESNQGVFNAESNLHDKRYDDEFERLVNIRQEGEDATHNAEINLREKEEALAQIPKPTEGNNATLWVIFAVAVTVFSIGFAPTFHDVFLITLSMVDPLAGWLLSIAASIPIGAILALLILVEFGRKIASFNWLGLAAGILVAIGFLLIRRSVTGELDSLSVGLTVYEIALIVGLEACAYFRRKAKKEAQEQAEIFAKAEKDLEVAMKQKERSVEHYEKTDAAIKQHIEYIEQRNVGTLFNAEIEEALVAAATAGYQAGVRYNHGKKIGRKEGHK